MRILWEILSDFVFGHPTCMTAACKTQRGKTYYSNIPWQSRNENENNNTIPGLRCFCLWWSVALLGNSGSVRPGYHGRMGALQIVQQSVDYTLKCQNNRDSPYSAARPHSRLLCNFFWLFCPSKNHCVT